MKKYRINPSALMSYTGDRTVKGGFNIVKISEEDALCCLQKPTSSENFFSALAEAGITRYEPLKENEVYNGYIAVWKGYTVKIYYLGGSMQIYPRQEANLIWDYFLREAAKNGELLELAPGSGMKFVSPICRVENCGGCQKLADAMTSAIRNNNKVISLEPEVKERLIRGWASEYRRALTEI